MKKEQYYKNLPKCSIVDYELIPYLEAALLWCGVGFEELSEIITEVSEMSSGIFKHSLIPCLQKKTRVLDLAIRQGNIRAVREHGLGGEIEVLASGEKYISDQVACGRRHFWVSDLKKFISDNYPNDRPKTIFYEEELKPIIDEAEYERMTKEYQKLLSENTRLQTKLTGSESEIRDANLAKQSLSIQAQQAKAAQLVAEENLEKGRNFYRGLLEENCKLKKQLENKKYIHSGNVAEKSETSYLNMIQALKEVCLDSNFTPKNQQEIISHIADKYTGYPGVSEANLRDKFSKANKIAP